MATVLDGPSVFPQRYYRNARGKIIHKDSCRHATARTAVPWTWADGFSEFYVRNLVASQSYPWLQLCKECW